MKVLFLPLLPLDSPKKAGSKARVYQYLGALKQHGIIPTVVSPIKGVIVSKVFWAVRILIYTFIADIIFIQKRLFPKWFLMLIKTVNKKIIFDFDDAIFICPSYIKSLSEREKQLREKRLTAMLRQSAHVIVGNKYLKEYVINYNKNVTVIPTAVNCEHFHPLGITKNSDQVVIGWVGQGEQHLMHLRLLIQPLKRLCQKYNILLRIIGTMGSQKIKDCFSSIDSLNVQLIDWIDWKDIPKEIAKFDIGVMPLIDDERTRGKCAGKLLEYMAMGIPPVCSPVGINKDIIEDGINGFCAATPDEWVDKLSRLIENPKLRQEIGKNARFTVKKYYSTDKTIQILLNVLEKVKKCHIKC